MWTFQRNEPTMARRLPIVKLFLAASADFHN
jgi:hypothetical protein